MKGVVLAGGTGTRLDPLTRVTNKHLLPVYNRPMIYFPLSCLALSGIEEAVLVTSPRDIGLFRNLLGDGREVGLKRLSIATQARAGGIADALAAAEPFMNNERCLVMLGDNIVEYTLRSEVAAFELQTSGARVLLTQVDDPSAFGIAEFDGDRMVRIVEKPVSSSSRLAVAGIYMYDQDVFDVVRTLRPSQRGELEITDVNNAYLANGTLTHGRLQGWWTDAGESCDQYLATCNRIAEGGANHDPADGPADGG